MYLASSGTDWPLPWRFRNHKITLYSSDLPIFSQTYRDADNPLTNQGSNNRIRLNQVLVDFAALKLQIDGIWYDIEARQLALLRLLIEHQGQAVSRQQIMDKIWPDVVVSDNSVSQAVTQLRKSLQEPKDSPTFIRTVPRKGYQLVADIHYPDAQQKPVATLTLRQAGGLGAAVLVLFALCVWWLWPANPEPYHHKAQLTASPGDEAFLTLSPDKRYLLFTQQDAQSGLRDLMVFDRQSENIHALRQSGYDELSPAWSPDGQRLAYIRQNAFSCQIRTLTLSGPVETWRLSKDVQLTGCQTDSGQSKLRWTQSGLFYLDPVSQQLMRLNLDAKPVEAAQHWQNVAYFDVDVTGRHLLRASRRGKLLHLDYDDLKTAEQQYVQALTPPIASLKWQVPGQQYWLAGQQLRLADIDGTQHNLAAPPGFIMDLAQVSDQKSEQLFLASGTLQANLVVMDMQAPQQLHALTSSPNFEYLPALSADGLQTAYISQYFDYVDQQLHQEVWVKHSQKTTATLLTALPDDVQPDYLAWSPQGSFLLLQDKQQRVFLLNLYARSLHPVLTDFKQVSALYWLENEQQLYFSAIQGDSAVAGKFDLQKQQVDLIAPPAGAPVLLNASFDDFNQRILDILTAALPEIPAARLAQAITRIRPALTPNNLYFVLPGLTESDVLKLDRQTGEVQLVHQLAIHQQHLGLTLNLAVSPDEQQMVMSVLSSQQNNLMLRERQ